MAIIGSIEVLKAQCSSKFDKVIDYLENTDLEIIFKDLEHGKNVSVELDGKKVIAIYQTYPSKAVEDAKMEGHQNYIDVQYIHSGKEQIFVTNKAEIISSDEYDADKDLYFVKTKNHSTFFQSAGIASILYPADLHAPGVAIDGKSEKIQKIVFKVAVED